MVLAAGLGIANRSLHFDLHNVAGVFRGDSDSRSKAGNRGLDAQPAWIPRIPGTRGESSSAWPLPVPEAFASASLRLPFGLV